MDFPFDDIHEKIKTGENLVGREVYMMVNSSATSINDLVIAKVEEVVSKRRDEQGVVVRATQRYINKDMEEELIERQGHAIYLIIGENKVMTSNGPMMVIAQCDDFGPFVELTKKEDMAGKYYANAVFRYRGIFFFFKITGNYLFDDEESLINCIEELDALKADITDNGIIIKLFGEQFLITKYQMSIDQTLYNEPKHKKMAYEAICKNEGVKPGDKKRIKLNFRRYILKFI